MAFKSFRSLYFQMLVLSSKLLFLLPIENFNLDAQFTKHLEPKTFYNAN